MWRDEVKKIEKCPQRQDSTADQLADLIPVAEKLGFYDAADFIKLKLSSFIKLTLPKARHRDEQ